MPNVNGTSRSYWSYMTYTRQLKYLDLILKNDKIPHAFLFYGTDLAYQRKLAKDFLARLNGAESKNQIERETHPDILFVDRREGKKEVALAQIRELKEFVSRTSLALQKKGVFITEAEYLNEEGWNALLKTLEEPAGNTIIFIISANLKKIPSTIISRAVSLPFYVGDISSKPHHPKDDIILNKLAGLEKLSWAERIDLAEAIAQRETPTPVLDSWLLQLRSEILSGTGQNYKVNFIESVAEVKNLIATTNVNVRLALENLFLKM